MWHLLCCLCSVIFLLLSVCLQVMTILAQLYKLYLHFIRQSPLCKWSSRKPNDPSTTISGCLEFQIKVSLLAANNKSELFRVEKSLANCGTPHSSISLDSLFNINWQLVPRSLWLNIKCGHLVMPCELTETKVNESFTSLITPCSGFF